MPLLLTRSSVSKQERWNAQLIMKDAVKRLSEQGATANVVGAEECDLHGTAFVAGRNAQKLDAIVKKCALLKSWHPS